jgi:hypothetical protein
MLPGVHACGVCREAALAVQDALVWNDKCLPGVLGRLGAAIKYDVSGCRLAKPSPWERSLPAPFLIACEGPRRTCPAAGAFACLLVPGQAGGATVDAAGGATVDVRTAGAGGAAAARTPAVAAAPPARLSPAMARAARLVRTDISISLDDEEEPRDPRHLFDLSTNYTYAEERVFKAVRRPAR